MKTVKVLVAASMAAALLAGCGSKTDTDTFRFASELDIQGMDSAVVDDGMSYNAIHAISGQMVIKSLPTISFILGRKLLRMQVHMLTC